MVKKTILATLLSTGTIIIVLKVGLGAFIVDFLIRILNPLTSINSVETAHIMFASLITAIVTTLLLKEKLPLPKFIKKWL